MNYILKCLKPHLFFQEQKRKDKQFALVIGFLNADFCSEKGDVLDENRKKMLLKNTFKNRGTKGKRKTKKNLLLS